MAKIDWSDMLDGNFVKLEDGVVKELVLKNWRPQEKFKDEKTNEVRKGIEFDVWQEDNIEYDETTKKAYTVTAIRLLSKLKPIIMKAEVKGLDNIHISVVRVGEGKKTEFSVKDLTEVK